jgi:hypothetical protein
MMVMIVDGAIDDDTNLWLRIIRIRLRNKEK